jgi:hypothetical protein
LADTSIADAAMAIAEARMTDERFRWLPRWIARELEDAGRFSWHAFMIVTLLCLFAYFLLQHFGGVHPGLF